MAVRFPLLLFLLLLPGTAFAATGGGISVTVTVRQVVAVEVTAPANQTGDPNRILFYRFTVQNTGTGPDAFNLSAGSSQRFGVNLPEGNLAGPLNPGDTASVLVELSIPGGEPAGTQDILTLTATSQADRKISDSAFVTTNVNQAAGVTLNAAGRNRSGRSGETVTHAFTVTNAGNGTDQFQLAASSSQGWAVVLPGGNLTGPLTAGKGGRSKVKIEVEVTIDPAATEGTVDTLTLTATSQLDAAVSTQASVDTTVVIRGRKP